MDEDERYSRRLESGLYTLQVAISLIWNGYAYVDMFTHLLGNNNEISLDIVGHQLLKLYMQATIWTSTYIVTNNIVCTDLGWV